ncbi:MAG: hypothetical protein ABIB79_04420 [archaeon]
MLNQRVSIFIDGSNLYHNLKRYGISIKFEELVKLPTASFCLRQICLRQSGASNSTPTP